MNAEAAYHLRGILRSAILAQPPETTQALEKAVETSFKAIEDLIAAVGLEDD